MCEVVTRQRDRPDAATYAGSGKVEELQDICRLHDARSVVFDHALTAAQIRNLENAPCPRAARACGSSTAPT